MWLAGAFWSGEDFGAVRSLFGIEAHLALNHGLTHPDSWLAHMGGLPRLATWRMHHPDPPRERVGLYIGGSGASIVINLSKVDYSVLGNVTGVCDTIVICPASAKEQYAPGVPDGA